MGDALNSVLEALRTPETRHAALVHMPIALSVLAAALAIAAGIRGPKHTGLRWLVAIAYALLAASAWVAAEAGEEAEAGWGPGLLAPGIYATFEQHEEAAEKVVPMAMALTVVGAIALGAAMAGKRRVATAASWLVAAGGLGLAGWVGWVGHLGGTMVYAYGAGTPFPTAADGGPVAPPADPPLPGEDEDGAADPRLVVFRQLRPILEEHCMRCHNPQRSRRAGGLDQTTIAGILAGGDSGPALVPGQPGESLMLRFARHEVEDMEMPPDDDKLPDEDLDLLELWIRQGAVWEQ